MIVTATVQKNLSRLDVALRSSTAVLIQGEMGCGKSASVMKVAESNGFREKLIQLNVDDSFDSKDLLGKYSATEVPGVFDWVAGPLTEAVEKGLWILMEDVDLASFDVFSVILTLLEDKTLFIADKNTTISAHPDFKLIATQQLLSSTGNIFSAKKSNAVPYIELWGVVVMDTIPALEACEIVESLHSRIPPTIVRELATLRDNYGAPLINLRSLLKWSTRVAKRLANGADLTSGDFISSHIREVMLAEAFDCFIAKYPPGKEQNDALSSVSVACGVPPNIAAPLVMENKPIENVADDAYNIGRVALRYYSGYVGLSRESRTAFAPTRLALSLLERLAASVESKEHVLLTGETGVGKTFIVQYLADKLGQKLIVHNLNQQTDTTDFMGGWKPLDVGVSVRELSDTFSTLFSECFSSEKNIEFLGTLQSSLGERKWEKVLKLILKGCRSFEIKNKESAYDPAVATRWEGVLEKTNEILNVLDKSKANFAFRFEEGSLVRAWREGHWLLLDELNLATNEVLERVSSVLGDVDRLFLTDKATEPIMRHKNFHVFANMNPPTDVGKKDLPPSLRSRFVEYYVSEPFNRSDVTIVVNEYIGFLTTDDKVEQITLFFLDCVNNARTKLCAVDGESKPPSFSLRTLTRSLSYVRKAAPFYGFTVALYDGLLLGFATPLQRKFHAVVDDLIIRNIFNGKKPPQPTLPQNVTGNGIPYEHIWIPRGSDTPYTDEGFILTKSVGEHLRNLARAVFANRPVLLEGPTSSGKSSMVKYLSEMTGNRFVRINNHDSTEVQEYLGHYVTDEQGKLRFVDGILVTAVRNGYWVVLDELNLAPSDVLEALNRLLDDNCELFIPDTQETIKPHPQLRIFATQNPAGIYGGRKMLSRAFRNRFLEITVDEIPVQEISYILQKRYMLPESFSDKMVEIMTSLQVRRQNSQIFAGKHGFITPRDLFRWAERKPQTYQELAEHGFLLLGERCRKDEERQTVKDVIETVTKTELIESVIYSPSHWSFVNHYYSKVNSGVINEYKIVWTESMQRLFTIVGICLEHEEPVLLVGETGSSKTTVCQLWAALLDIPLQILNCHQHTEAADFLGGLRPAPPERRERALFEWQNGPLVQSMIDGHYFLLDEISLTEDSVLERLNSVLEPSRSVTLAEKSSADHITAHERFRILATMNPGGDFGKKELSPALRNRFTEIYVRPTTDENELTQILSKRLDPNLAEWASRMASVLVKVSQLGNNSGVRHVSIRDIISWASFMNAANGNCSEDVSFLHGLDAVVLDGIGVGTGQSESSALDLRNSFIGEIAKWVPNHAELLSAPFWSVFNSMQEPTLPVELQKSFYFGAPTTSRNLSKLMRASIVKKAVLLEGSPGVGKTSLVVALGCALGHPVVRINLSEQTDIMDLFGTFLPAPSDSKEGPQFMWSDGVLLRALKEGSWVVLDELNLASQTVLEGLNALLDHRSAVFIPELNKEFHAHENFRVFACQNPLIEGGGRKGLPRSFLNRFIKARIEAFERSDLLCIATAVCPDVEAALLEKMVDFVDELQHATMVKRAFGVRGSPWEFNLRDVLRWINMMQHYNEVRNPMYFADVLFVQRMRTEQDRERCRALLLSYFPDSVFSRPQNSDFLAHENAVYFEGRQLYSRNVQARPTGPLFILPSQAEVIRAILMCAENRQFGLVVGPTGSGKSYALKVATQLAGAKLVTFSMNASCDTVDLLGGFDQVEGKQGHFEWRDSIILEAMLQGHWLVLDNVNYCNASVLDRLNPLVEPDGVLSINEQGLVNGEVRVIKPHPDFRMFATLNPKYGEISRAMRNRAVEVYATPVAIPSTESLLLSYDANTNDSTTQEALNDKLNQFHRDFVQIGFHADSKNVSSPALSDALSIGAPNIFTILRASSMVRWGQSIDVLREAIMHCYVDNRSGHWRSELETVLNRLEDVMNKDSRFVDAPPIRALHESLTFHLQDSFEDDDVERVLADIRVRRSGLHLQKCGPDDLTALLYFILDQCNDSAPLTLLSDRRMAYLSELGVPEDLIRPIVAYKFSTPDALPQLFCRSFQLLGPHSKLLSVIADATPQPTNMPHVNTKALAVVRSCVDNIASLSDPVAFQGIVSMFVVFAESISAGKIDVDNYIDLVTVALLLREVCAGHQPILQEAIEEFLQSLEQHFDLPFPLLGGKPILESIVPKPYVASAEERDAMKTWREFQLLNVGSSTLEKRLRPLWLCAAFRAEFSLINLLVKLSGATTDGLAGRLFSTLKSRIASFVECFTKTIPVFTNLDVTLWTSLMRLGSTEEDYAVVSSLAPLIITNFFCRYQVDSVENLFVGAWIENASNCLQVSSRCSVLDVGKKGNENSALMDGFLKFLTHCPVSEGNPFFPMRSNSKGELVRIVKASFPALADAPLEDMQVSSLYEKCRSVMDTYSQTDVVAESLQLFQFILGELERPNSNIYVVMTMLWALKCRLLLPRSPIDDMYRLRRKMEVSTREKALFAEMEDVFTVAESYTMRAASTPQKELLAHLRAVEEKQLREAEANYVERPDVSGLKYAQLVRRLYQFKSSFLSDDRLQTLAQSHDQDATVRRNWSTLVFDEVKEILAEYGGYEDVTLNFCQSALFAMIACQASSYTAGQEEANMDTLFSRNKTLRLLQFPNLSTDKLPLPPVTSRISLKHYVSYLDSCLTLMTSACAVQVDFEFAKGVFEAYRHFYGLVENLEAEERKADEMAVLYKEKAVIIEGDDEKFLRNLKEMFPSYEQEFTDLLKDADDTTTAEEEPQLEAKTAKHARILLKEEKNDYIRKLVATHHTFYFNLITPNALHNFFDIQSALQSYRQRFDVLIRDVARMTASFDLDDATSSSEKMIMTGFSYRAAQLKAQLHEPTQSLADRQSSNFNIFKDPEPAEVSRFSVSLGKLMDSIDRLLSTFPDTISILRCKKIAEKIAILPALSTPLMKIMSGCEVLLKECYEWERNASTQYSLIEEMTELSSFVLRWRRLELHCWRHVFNTKREEFELTAFLEWFRFYDIIREDYDDEVSFCIRLFEHISQYMWSACFGDYHTRLELIEGFGNELIATCGFGAPAVNTLFHLINFFRQYKQLIDENCQKLVRPIEEDMEDFTKIMRWEDANYYAVRATSEKSHLKVARSLSSLEEVLRTPILSTIQTEEQRIEDDAAMGFQLASPAKAAEPEPPAKGKAKGAVKRARHNKPIPKSEAVIPEKESTFSQSMLQGGLDFFVSSSGEIIERVHTLQQKGTAQQLKLRALKTLYDVMSDSGVPQNYEEQVVPWEALFPSFESILGCKTCRVKEENRGLATAAEDYYRFVRWIQRMREAKRKPHDDLSGAQASRGAGMTESLFADCNALLNLLTTTFNLSSQIRLFLLVGKSITSSPTAESEHHSVDPLNIILNVSVRECCHAKCFYDSIMCITQQNLISLSETESTLLNELRVHTDVLWNYCREMDPLRGADVDVPCGVKENCLQHLQSITGVAGRLKGNELSSYLSKTAAALEEQCLAGLKQLECDGEPSEKRLRSTNHTGPELLEKVKNSLDDVEATFVAEVAVEETDDAATAVYSTYRDGVAGLLASFTKAEGALKESLSALPSLEVTHTDYVQLYHRCQYLQDSLDDFSVKVAHLFSEHSKFGTVIARLFTVLMKKGFCKTEDEEENNDEGEGDGGQQEGTGMDDGEGEKDVTDQIDNEDQLMNMKDKEESKEEKNDREEDEEDNAADVETDFKGDKEGREESEKDEDDENEGDESDKEVGSVDEEDEMDRKRTKKDENDDDDMREDDGAQAEDVPQDEFGDEQLDEETGGFKDKEKEIKDAEEKQEGEHELVADDENPMSDDGQDSQSGDTGEDSRSSDDVEDELENEKDDLEESIHSSSHSSNGHFDEDASTDNERSQDGEREIENEEEDMGSDADGEFESNSDAPDENVFEGGQQDENTGKEDTENKKEKTDNKQPDAVGNEEEQAGDEQELDDTGRNWKKQQEQNLNAQRKDNTDQNRSKKNNPYKAVKEALKRHQQQVQQLNLNKQVEVKDDDDEKKEPKEGQKEDEEVDDFEFDSEGEQEGMAATDNRPEKPTEAEEPNLNERQTSDHDGEDGEGDEEADEEAPQDTRKKRKKPVDNVNEIEQDEEDESKTKKDKSKGKLKVSREAKLENEEESDAHSSADEEKEEEEKLNLDEKMEKGRKLWQEQESAVQGLSHQLCEQLRLILAPTLADKLQGDYKTGKRLNMKRIIPYIASQYKKDRIWLRRTKPNKRTYQVIIALDDSQSMQGNNAGVLSCRAVALIAKALQQLEVGEMGILTFGRETNIIHRLEDQFIADSGSRAFSEITFAQKSTNLKNFFETSLNYLDESRDRQRGQTRSTTEQLQQVLFVISDGQLTEDRMELKKLMARAEINNQMVVFILLDILEETGEGEKPSAPQPISAEDLKGLSTAERIRRLKSDRESRLKRVQSKSVLDMQIVEFSGNKVIRKPYMEDFPFPYYVIVRDIDHLPEIVSDAMRQWFELLNSTH